MNEKCKVHFLARHTCYFVHRQFSNAHVIVEDSADSRIWFEYDYAEADKPKSRLCVYCALDIRCSFRDELQKAARGEITPEGVEWTIDVTRKRGQRFEFPSGLSEGCSDRLSQVSQDLHTRAERLVSNFRWRLDLTGPGKFFAKRDFLWSEDGKHFIEVPHTAYGSPEIQRDIIVENLDKDIIQLVREPQRNEPIGHTLLRDAWQFRWQDHKSALTQGVAALEVAVKHCIVKLVPEVESLVLEMPTPPVTKLLGDYLPELTKKKAINVPSLPATLLKSVQSMVHQRNMLVHKGDVTAGPEKVTEYLEIIRDILYYLDFVAGNTWAMSVVSADFKDWIRTELPDLDVTDPLFVRPERL